jgi:hypothetical protein
MTEEIWYDIPDYEGFYQCSNFLRIRSLDRIIYRKDGDKKLMKGRVLKIVHTKVHDKKGYCVVFFSKQGKVSTIHVHKLFAEMFLDNPLKLKIVNHKNGDKHDYSLQNLEWVSKGDDIRHAYETGLRSRTKKKGNIGRNGGRKVLDISTGIVYDFISDAAKAIGIPSYALQKRVTGKIKNKTNMRLI